MKIPIFESVSSMEHLTVTEASKGNIDAVSNMKNDKIYVFAGRADTQINPRKFEQDMPLHIILKSPVCIRILGTFSLISVYVYSV